MTDDETIACIRLLKAADDILMARQEYLVAAHLSLAIELLMRRVPTVERQFSAG